MRQWELAGITDWDPNWTPPRSSDRPTVVDGILDSAGETRPLPEVLWSTDAALRITSASWAAAELVGLPDPAEGVSLLEVFGLEGTGAGVVAAHVEALCGRQAAFAVDRQDRAIRCRAIPLRGDEGEVAGTICVGIHEVTRPDLTVVDDDSEPIRVA
jgi:PAS domain-containing protein